MDDLQRTVIPERSRVEIFNASEGCSLHKCILNTSAPVIVPVELALGIINSGDLVGVGDVEVLMAGHHRLRRVRGSQAAATLAPLAGLRALSIASAAGW